MSVGKYSEAGADMITFADLMSTFSSEEGKRFSVEAPESWSQGRTLYGGLSAALCHVTAKAQAEIDKPMKSALVCFVGPAGGVVSGESEVLRRGKSTVVSQATLRTEQGVGTRAVFVYGDERESRLTHSDLKAPDVLRADACESMWREGRRGPGFAGNFEVRKAGGLFPISGADRGEMLVWVRHKTPTGPDHTAALLAIADVLPPACFTMFQEPAPLSTITWSMEFLQPEFDVSNNWFLFHTIAEHTAGGYSSQAMYLYDEAGRPIIAGRQNVTIFY